MTLLEPFSGGILNSVLEIAKARGRSPEAMRIIKGANSFIADKHLSVYDPAFRVCTAEVCRDIGDFEGFRSDIKTAIEKFRALEMNWDLQRALKLKAEFSSQ